MTEFILHAGLHKTATTSLQELVFPNVMDAVYTGKSREIMATRENKHQFLRSFFDFVQNEEDAIRRLPLHTCRYYLALIQDYLVAKLSRSKFGTKEMNLELSINKDLLDRIAALSPSIPILYSCEGLLLTAGQLEPERVLARNSSTTNKFVHKLPPLFYWKDIFPGSILQVIVYVRSPIDYLFSRYIQIHAMRLAHGMQSYYSPKHYFKLQTRLHEGPNKYQSVFFHADQQILMDSLRTLGVSVKLRSFEKHIKNSPSITREFKKAFGLSVRSPEQIDQSFKSKALNTTSRDKVDAVEALCNVMGIDGVENLKATFVSHAMRNKYVQAALSNKVFPY